MQQLDDTFIYTPSTKRYKRKAIVRQRNRSVINTVRQKTMIVPCLVKEECICSKEYKLLQIYWHTQERF